VDVPASNDVLIACVDVDYRPTAAVAAGLWFRGWTAAVAEHRAVASFAAVANYEPGEFYRRELPCLLGVLDRGPRPEAVLVDGYVWLGNRRPGLGAHLHAAIGGVVIGVAKTRFASATESLPVFRGTSRSPLYVSAVGVNVEAAAEWVAMMHGRHRIPTLLRQVDTLAREKV
jgi:deoxyribonuclease V